MDKMRIAKTPKAEKAVFDSVLKKLVNAPKTPRAKMEGKQRGKRGKVIAPRPTES